MANGTTLNTGAGGHILQTNDTGAGYHVQVSQLATGAYGTAEALVAPANPLPVQVGDGTNTLAIHSGAGDGAGVAKTLAPATAGLAVVSATNANAAATIAAVAGQRHRLTFLAASYSAAPTGGRLTVVDGSTTILDADVVLAGPTAIPLPPGGLAGSVNTALVVTLYAGGSSVVGKLSYGKLTF